MKFEFLKKIQYDTIINLKKTEISFTQLLEELILHKLYMI